MRKANLIKITNTTPYAIVMWPKRRTYRDKIAVLVGSNSWKILDLASQGLTLDLDTYYFQFQNDKKRIKLDDLNQYGISVEYQLT